MKLRPFQKADLARAALVDGCVLGWDTGLGKTFAMLTWPLLKCGASAVTDDGQVLPVDPAQPAALAGFTLRPNGAVLLIAPGDLHDNILSEARTHFRAQVTRVTSQEQFLALVRRDATGKPYVPPGFYLASYTEIATNGIDPFPDIGPAGVRAFMEEWRLPLARGVEWYGERGTRFAACYEAVGGKAAMSLPQLERAARKAIAALEGGHASPEMKRALVTKVHTALASLTLLHCELPDAAFAHLPLRNQDWCLTQLVTEWLAAGRDGLGQTLADVQAADPDFVPTSDFPLPTSPRCLHSPALVDLCADLFQCVVLDEGVRMKGDDTLIGQGIRRLTPRYRLVLTGTPIKNRLPDLFWLITWATGMAPEGSPRWPFPANADAKRDFADEFMVTETNLTQAAKAGKKGRRPDKRFVKTTPEVCQLHRLYKLLGPNLLRRRKDDLGEDIVKKKFQEVHVPMGTAQQQVYAHHLAAGYWCGPVAHPMKNPMMQLTALRQAAAAPHSANLLHQADARVGQARSTNPWTPKLSAALSIIRDALQRGKQVIVFSAFHEATATLGRCLDEAGVPYVKMDGDVSPKRRGRLSEQFKAGATLGRKGKPVALCGIEATAEGHNWWRAGVVIRYDLSLALDKNEQSINRAHRLTSPEDVEVWDILVDGTTDAKLRQLSRDKGDAADLVLDGRLMGERPEEVNPAALLNLASSLFAADTKTLAESAVQTGWETELRGSLKAAAEHWLTLAAASVAPPEVGSAKPEAGSEAANNAHPSPFVGRGERAGVRGAVEITPNPPSTTTQPNPPNPTTVTQPSPTRNAAPISETSAPIPDMPRPGITHVAPLQPATHTLPAPRSPLPPSPSPFVGRGERAGVRGAAAPIRNPQSTIHNPTTPTVLPWLAKLQSLAQARRG